MAERLTFTLAGRDELSRVLNGTADNADRLRLRLAGISADADGSLRDLQGRFLSVADAQRQVDDRTGTVRRSMTSLSDEVGKVGDALKTNLISLLPAAIPLAAGLTGSAAALAGQLGAVGVAAGVYALALGPQVSAIGEAVEAQEKYQAAVDESGATSKEAIKAQIDYQRQLEKMPQPTREAAVAVGILKDNYQEWSDSLAGDVMAPFTKGVAVTNALLPTTTGLVKGASAQFDRLITLVGGAISTPGFDALNNRFTDFTERTMRRGVDGLTLFFAKLEAGEYDGGGLSEFFDYAQQAGPMVWDTLENIADALLNVVEAGSGVGIGMLEVINALSGIVSAVPPEAIATVLQLAIAIKAVKLAAAGAAAGQAALAALGVQIGAMRAAAAAAPGPLAATSAAVATLGRTAKIAIAGTGIGLLVIGLSELAQVGRSTPPDVDKLTTSLGKLGESGKATGYVAEQFGEDFGKLREQIQKVIDPSVSDSIDNWGADITDGFLSASDSMEEFNDSVGSIDEGLAALVSGGKADQAAAAVKAMTEGMSAEQVAKFTGELDLYKEALTAQAFEAELAATAQGLFGEQAQQVQAQLDAQRASADGLSQSINALSNAALVARGGIRGMEAAIDAADEAFKKNGATLDENTEKGRANNAALDQLASATMEAAEGARANGESWETVNGIYARGREQLVANAVQMGLTKSEAKALADQILLTPNKTAKLEGDMQDLQAKLDEAKAKLKTVPDSRKAKVRADINQLERQLEAARRQLDGINGKTATTYVVTHYKIQGATGEARNLKKLRPGSLAQGGRVPGYADGGDIQYFPGGGYVSGPGGPREDAILALLASGAIARVSDTEFVVQSAAVNKYGVPFLDAVNSGLLNPALVKAAGYASGGAVGGGFTYSPTESTTAQISLSTVSSWYDKDVQRLKDAWAQLNEALRDQAKKSTAATRRAVAEARKAVNEADRALGLKAGSKAPAGFSLTGYSANLKEAVKKSEAWERDLSKIGRRAGADIEEILRGMGESGRALVASLAKASSKEFAEIVKNLRKLAPEAAATLSDFSRQLNATTAGSKTFQDNLLKLAARGHGDLAMQLAGQGDADAMALAAAAVKSPLAAKKANAAVKNNAKLLTAEELEAAALMMGALSKKGATVESVVRAGVSWPMLVSLAPRYAKEIRALAGGPSFVKEMKERGITLAEGGLLVGPGTSTSDSIPLWGSHGEYMIKAAAVAKYGVKFMDALNAGQLPIGRPARPGLPAAPAQAAPVAGGDRPSVTYQVYPRASVIDVEDLRLLQRQEEARERVRRPR
ncbi:hypothetical protein [Streptomyces hirsutus]|uniref:hypothetical protein n=1 Tax=Streptomyces hirsutus TaxID=35620 RepID=UPI00368D11F2